MIPRAARIAALAVAGLVSVPVPFPAAAAALKVIQGPVEADVTSVTDGDTLRFIAYPFPEMTVSGVLRVDGIDTPEKRGKCQYEKDLAIQARDLLEDLVEASGGRVRLYVLGLEGEDGGGFGRYRAQVKIGGEWLSERMIAEGLARENHGEPRKPWCPAP